MSRDRGGYSSKNSSRISLPLVACLDHIPTAGSSAQSTALGYLDGFLISQLAGEDEPVLSFSYFPISHHAYQTSSYLRASLPKGTGVS